MTGLTSALYSWSLCALFGLNASLTTFLITPLRNPAGLSKGSTLEASPAISPLSGVYL